MPRPLIDLHRKIKDTLRHTRPMSREAAVPFAHYQDAIAGQWGLLRYVHDNFKKLSLSKTALNSHLAQLNSMLLIHLIESFERLLKELAAVCVDVLAPCILDDRFNVFRLQGSALAAHFEEETIGKSLCESSTWLDCDEINDRFRKLLKDPFTDGGDFTLFKKHPAASRARYDTLSLVWQLRHTMVHNVGVITHSDAVKLRLFARENVQAKEVLSPTKDDLRYLKRFLDETAAECNKQIGDRLAELLTTLHQDNPSLFAPRDIADQISRVFGFALTVDGVVGTP